MEPIINQLWEIENDSRILEFRYQYKDTLVWPFIRYAVISSVIRNILQYGDEVPSSSRYTNYSSVGIGKYVLKEMCAFIKNPFFSSKKSIMFLYGCTGNIYDDKGRIYNRIFDEFVKIYKDNTYVLDGTDRDLMKKSQVRKHYSCLVDSIINIMVENTKAEAGDVDMANQFLKYLKEKIPSIYMTNVQMNVVKNALLLYSKKIRYQDIFYGMLFQLVKPKVVFLEDGCYGERNAYICKILHERGIVGAEIQHGFISKTHCAYNYGEFIRTSKEYKRYMPDYYCGMSDYWLKQINAPAKKVSLGNPMFYKQYSKFYEASKREEKNRIQKTILWLGFDNNRQTMHILDNFLQIADSEYRIIIRLHPLVYKKNKESYARMCKKYKMLSLDNNSTSHSIYETLIKCDYVVSDYSTVIYEAIEFGKKVFIYKNRAACFYGTTHLGNVFENEEELINFLHESDNYNDAIRKYKKGEFFDVNWKENYKAFIKLVCM